MTHQTAILLIAGQGTRFKTTTPKQFLQLAGRPLYQHSLDALIASQVFDEIIVVVPPGYSLKIDGVKIVTGGATRQQSAYRGLKACSPKTEYVLIHDGARPFLTVEMIHAALNGAHKHGAINTCIPSSDTLIYSPDGETIESIPKRAYLYRGQTPQAFAYPLIVKAHESANGDGATDDCQLVSNIGHKVHIVQGIPENIKVTNPIDMAIAEALMKRRKKD